MPIQAQLKLSIAVTNPLAASAPPPPPVRPLALGFTSHLSVRGATSAPAAAADSVSAAVVAASNSASHLALPDAEGAAGGASGAGVGASRAGSANGQGIRWADLEGEKERAGGGGGPSKKLPSMCDVR